MSINCPNKQKRCVQPIIKLKPTKDRICNNKKRQILYLITFPIDEELATTQVTLKVKKSKEKAGISSIHNQYESFSSPHGNVDSCCKKTSTYYLNVRLSRENAD